MNKLCVIYNFAPHYRSAVFQLIDKEYDCIWYFGNNTTDIEGLDLSLLKDVRLLKNKYLFNKPIYFQVGVLKSLYNSECSSYLILGELFCLSTWLFLFIKCIFFPYKRIYFWSHGWYGKENRVKKIIKKLFFKMADGTFLYGNYAKKLMIEEGFKDEQLFVLHNSLDYDAQLLLRNAMTSTSIYTSHFHNKNMNLIFVGRLTKVKKIDILIDALVILKKQGYLFNLTLIGDGIEREHLQSKVQNVGIGDQVWFLGACYDENVNAELIYNSDLCVAPGNVGLTSIHSMMYGTPVITHNSFQNQMPEFESIKPGQTGDFFQYNCVESLANCIKQWFELHTNQREMVRSYCYNEIDQYWTPIFQLNVLKNNLYIKND